MTWLKAIPTVSPGNEPFFAGLAQRKFHVLKCKTCGDLNWTPYPACRSCLSVEQDWHEVSGRGTLYTWSVVHTGPKTFTQDGPYVFAFAKLEEGPRPLIVMGNLMGCAHEDIRADMPIRIAYHDVPGHDTTLYHFEPV